MTVRIAIIGTGFMANRHARALTGVKGAHVSSVMHPNPDKAQAFAQVHGLSKIHSNIAAVASDADIDLAILTTPNYLHEDHALVLLNSGKDVFIEKPFATTVKACARLIEASIAQGRRIIVGHMWRFDVEARWMREQIDTGTLGDIVHTKSYGVHELWGPSGWFVEKKLSGGGALIDMGVHAIDTTRYLLGDPKPVSVYATIRTVHNDYNVDDMGIIMITWDSGTVSVIESGWWAQHIDGPEASTQLFGTEGYGRLYPTHITSGKHEKKTRMEQAFAKREEHCAEAMYVEQIRDMVTAIESGCPSMVGYEEGYVAMQICEAAYASAERNTVITL